MKRPSNAIAIAVVLALVAGLIVFWYTRGAQDRAVAEQQPVNVLVSSQTIPAGTSLQVAQEQGLAGTDQVPSNLQPGGSIQVVDTQNGGLVAVNDIPAGQVLLNGDFAAELPAAVPLRVPQGLVAVSVLLEDRAKVGSFLRPGSEIAIFDTVAKPTQSTRLLLDHIAVLAIGPVTAQEASSASGPAWDSQLVTVAVNQAQAETLVHAIQTGRLYMALLGDTTVLNPARSTSDVNQLN